MSDASSIVQTALAAYQLPRIAEIHSIRRLNNAVFAIHVDGADEPLVLRLHRADYRDKAHTEAELGFLASIPNVRVPQPIPTSSGQYVGPHHSSLLTWVAGRPLRPGCGLGPAAASAIGRALAHLHNAGNPFPTTSLPRWDADGLFTDTSPYRPRIPLDKILTPAQRTLFDDVEHRTRRIFTTLDTETNASGVIHGDFILGNCHLRRRQNAWDVGVVDFDDCGWGYFAYDMCAVLGNLADYADYPSLKRAFLHGYRTERALPRHWEEHFPVLMAARHAGHCLWVAGLDPSNPDSPRVADHVAMRIDLIQHCLSLKA